MVTAVVRASVLSGGKFFSCFLVFFFLPGFSMTGEGFSLQFLPQDKKRRSYSRSGEGSSKVRLKGGWMKGASWGSCTSRFL